MFYIWFLFHRFASISTDPGVKSDGLWKPEVQIPRDLGKLIKEMSYDVVEDFLKEHSALYNVIDKSEVKIFNKELNKMVSALVKKVYMMVH